MRENGHEFSVSEILHERNVGHENQLFEQYLFIFIQEFPCGQESNPPCCWKFPKE